MYGTDKKIVKNNNLSPVPMIIDTDLGNDIDDALALAMAHAMQNDGECELVGVAVNKDNRYAPALVDIINTFYERGEIEIGVIADGKTPEDGNFLKPIVEAKIDGKNKYTRSFKSYDLNAVEMYRKVLANMEDNSVSIVSIGFMTNLARLLVSSPDEHSELNGVELVAKKVRLLSVMAGEFTKESQANPDKASSEFNIKHDIDSARYVFDNWPAEVIVSGLEVGKQILYPVASIYNDFSWIENHPIVEAYKLYLEMPYDRPTWDLTSVLCAVRDADDYFSISCRGKVRVDERGVTRFEESAKGKHRYLVFDSSKGSEIQKLMCDLCSAEPVSLLKFTTFAK